MSIRSNMKNLQPRRQAYKREIQLLSKGFSAPKTWPDGKITVHPWDSDIDALLLERSKRGGRENLLYGILEHICGLTEPEVDQFVFSEINMVLLLARSIQFGGVVEYQSVCPYCKTTDAETINIPGDLGRVGEKQAGYAGYDEITLPECKDVVHVRPLLVKDHRKIEEAEDVPGSKTYSDRHKQLLFSIVSVNGGAPETLDEVATWYFALSPADAALLETEQEKLSPHLDNKIQHKCKKCAREFFHTLLFDQEFFPSRGTGQPAPAPTKNVPAGLGGK
jgi:hypothetical protein